MQQLTCPIPGNINPLQNNGFSLSIEKLPEISFFCQSVALPDLTLPPTGTSTPLVNIPFPGDKLSFGGLTATFMIDSEMANYIAVHNWLIGLGFPQSHNQYRKFIDDRTDNLNPTPALAAVSDGSLAILNSFSNPIKTVRFIGLFPTKLSFISFQSTNVNTNYLTATANFEYTYYTFE